MCKPEIWKTIHMLRIPLCDYCVLLRCWMRVYFCAAMPRNVLVVTEFLFCFQETGKGMVGSSNGDSAEERPDQNRYHSVGGLDV